MNQIPEKFLNDDGTVNTDALVKSYTELEKKIGAMVKIPGDDSDDESREKFRRAIGVPESISEYPTNDLFDDDSVRERFRDMGLTKTQVEKIYSIAEEFLSPVLSEIFGAQHTTTSMAELRKYFGDDEKMFDALTQINSFGEKFLPTEAFEALCATPQGIQSIHRMMQSMEPRVETSNNTSANLSDNELRRMMKDPKYWRDRDAEYVRKIESGFKKLYS